jgi:hypothetical protein
MPFFSEHPALRILFIVAVIVGIVLAGYRKRSASSKAQGERHRSYS